MDLGEPKVSCEGENERSWLTVASHVALKPWTKKLELGSSLGGNCEWVVFSCIMCAIVPLLYDRSWMAIAMGCGASS